MQNSVQPTAPATPPSNGTSSDGFVKVEGGTTEQVTEATSLMVAYSAIWLILVVVTFVTFRASRSLRAQAERADEAVRQLLRLPR